MKYTVIAPDGELAHHDGEIDWDAVVGHEGKARARLDPSLAVTGWANDCGLLFPDTYPRNVVGSCVLVALGAPVQPYAGPIVFTGWNPANTALGLLEICSLPEPVETLDTLHADVRRALAGDTPRDLSPSWAEQMREIADHVRTAPTPGLTVTPIPIRQGGAS